MRAQEPKSKLAAEHVVYPTGFDPQQRNLLFYDRDRSIVGSLHIEDAEFVAPGHTSVEISDTTLEPKQVAATSVKLRVNSWVKVSNKALGYTIPLAFAKGDVSSDWRH